MPSEHSASSNFSTKPKRKIVVDSVHGDIELSPLEWRIVDTLSFQRLRRLKQLQMAYLVYPNATHTRFAHSLGVLKVMQRILERVNADSVSQVSDEEKENLRLAALMHDIGHYPYSHLLEGVDRVILTEEQIGDSPRDSKKKLLGGGSPYPDHEEVGREILVCQQDILNALGDKARAEKVGHLFARTRSANQQLSKLIHSSLDMDRLDYLIRDSQATGVPYGLVDIHYLLNHVKRSPTGVIGITHKAVAAAEHLLLARTFLFRVVCQHKTIFGLEEAARQLLRRLRDRVQDQCGEGYGVPKDGDDVLEIARGDRLSEFTDALLDDIFAKAASQKEKDPIVRLSAKSIVSRRPPRLIWEKQTFREREEDSNVGEVFRNRCRDCLGDWAKEKNLLPGQFLICELKPIGFESRGSRISKSDAEKLLQDSEAEEMIRVFRSPDDQEPVDIVDLKHSLLSEIGSRVFRTYRLYLVCPDDQQDDLVPYFRKLAKDKFASISG